MEKHERIVAKERVKKFHLKHMDIPTIVRMIGHEEGSNPIDITEDEVRELIAELREEWEADILGEGKMRVVEEIMSLDDLEVAAWRDKKYNNVWKIKVLRVRLLDMVFGINKKKQSSKEEAKLKSQLAQRYNLTLPGLNSDKEEVENEE